MRASIAVPAVAVVLLALFVVLVDALAATNNLQQAQPSGRLQPAASRRLAPRRSPTVPVRRQRPVVAVARRRPLAQQRAAPTNRRPAFLQQSANTIKQCKCADLTPCKERYVRTFEPCLDSCQSHVMSLGGNYDQVKQCFKPKQNLLKAAMECTEDQHANSCSRDNAIRYVPKRYQQTLENAAMAEIDRMIGRMGLDKNPSMKKLIGASKKMFGCIKRCMTRTAASCDKQLNCGLLLPSDREVVANTKQCAMKSGFNTANAQQMCRCVANAGVQDLKSVCQKIVIS